MRWGAGHAFCQLRLLKLHCTVDEDIKLCDCYSQSVNLELTTGTQLGVWRKHNQLDENKMSHLVFHGLQVSGSGSWGGSSLNREAQTFLSLTTFTSSPEDSQGVWPAVRCNLSSLS